MRKEPKATLLRETSGATYWRIDWPSTMQKWGKSYYATTYPDSEHVFLETAAKRRPVSELQARKIVGQVRAAIERARGTA